MPRTKKEASEKETVKKPAKTAAAKKSTSKKTTAKTAAAKKPAAKRTVKKLMNAAEYSEKIESKKAEAHDKNWLYIEVNAGDLNREFEEKENLEAVCTAITDELLEGDCFIIDPLGTSAALTVRYYVDNLSPERRKYYDVL